MEHSIKNGCFGGSPISGILNNPHIDSPSTVPTLMHIPMFKAHAKFGSSFSTRGSCSPISSAAASFGHVETKTGWIQDCNVGMQHVLEKQKQNQEKKRLGNRIETTKFGCNQHKSTIKKTSHRYGASPKETIYGWSSNLSHKIVRNSTKDGGDKSNDPTQEKHQYHWHEIEKASIMTNM